MKIKQYWKEEWFYWLLLVVFYVVFAVFYPSLPEQVPTSLSFSGEIQAYSSRITLAWLSLVPLAIYVGMSFAPVLDPKRQNYARFRSSMSMLKGILMLVMMGMVAIFMLLGFNPEMKDRIPIIIMSVIGLMGIGIGNYMVTVKQNFFIGIRTPWTLTSEENWNRTQRVGGRCMIIGGIAALVLSLLGWPIPAFIVFMVLMFIPTIYSFFLYQKGVR